MQQLRSVELRHLSDQEPYQRDEKKGAEVRINIFQFKSNGRTLMNYAQNTELNLDLIIE